MVSSHPDTIQRNLVASDELEDNFSYKKPLSINRLEYVASSI